MDRIARIELDWPGMDYGFPAMEAGFCHVPAAGFVGFVMFSFFLPFCLSWRKVVWREGIEERDGWEGVYKGEGRE